MVRVGGSGLGSSIGRVLVRRDARLKGGIGGGGGRGDLVDIGQRWVVEE